MLDEEITIKLPRQTTKKVFRDAKSREKGKLSAKIEEDQKVWKNKKHFLSWAKSFLENHAKEIPDWVAIAGMTIMVKRAIDLSEELRGKLAQIRGQITAHGVFPPIIAMYSGGISPTIADPRYMAKKAREYEGFFPDWFDWIVAFTLAVIIVRHAGQIAVGLGEIVGNLTKMIGFFLV